MPTNPTWRVAVLVFAFLGSVSFLAGRAGAQPGVAVPQFDHADSAAVEGVEIFDRIVYFPVSVDGHGPFPFALDTGAGQFTGFDDGTARSLSFASTIVGQGGGAGEDVVQFGLVDSVTIAIPGLAFQDRPIVTLPIRRMDAQWGKRKDGLFGGDLLSTMVTRIDYEREELVFHAAGHAHLGAGARIPLEVRGNYLFVRAKVFLYGQREPLDAEFMVDTGVRISVFTHPFAREHALAEQSPKTLTGITGFGIGGASRGVVGRVEAIEIGPYRFREPVVTFSTDEGGALASDAFAGIIGADFLSRFTVTFDYLRSQMVLQPNAGFDAPFEFDMAGLRVSMEGERLDRVVVAVVYEGTPAAEAGLRVGDAVTSIDGRPAGEFTKEDLRDYLQREGAAVRLVLEREGKAREVTLQLKRLI